MEARKLFLPNLFLQKPFPFFNTIKENCWNITIGERKREKNIGGNENSRLINRKTKILW